MPLLPATELLHNFSEMTYKAGAGEILIATYHSRPWYALGPLKILPQHLLRNAQCISATDAYHRLSLYGSRANAGDIFIIQSHGTKRCFLGPASLVHQV